MHLIERLLPERLGRAFRRIFAIAGLANLGDGILMAAGPLLVAQLTSDPLLISLALVAQQSPWFIVGLLAGVVADRVPRVPLLVAAQTLRIVALAGITALLLTGALSIWVLFGLLFLIGIGEVFFDNTWAAMIPDAVPKAHLGAANARAAILNNVFNQMAGPALGGALFALGALWPLSSTTILLALGTVLLLRLRLPAAAREPSPETAAIALKGAGARIRHDFTSGLRWLWGNAPVRTLFLVITTVNITFGMTWSVLVVWAQERVGVDAVGYGLLLAASAIGGVAGAALFGRLERRFSYGTMMRVCLSLEVAVHALLAVTTNPIVGAVVLVLFGGYATVWMTTSQTVRGRAVPTHVRGRVTSIYLLGAFGAVSIGAPIGGLIAQQFGVVATMLVACAGTAVIVASVWRQLPAIGRAGAIPEADVERGAGDGDANEGRSGI